MNELQRFEQEAFAWYIAKQAPTMLVGMTSTALIGAWIMLDYVPLRHVVVWLLCVGALTTGRLLFIRLMRPAMLAGRGFTVLLRGFALTSFVSGLTWGAFDILAFDLQRPLSLFLVGATLAGLVGGSVTSLAAYLPAYYLFAVTSFTPYIVLMLRQGGTEYYAASALCVFFLASNIAYAHTARRMQRDAIRLRFENAALIRDLELRKQAAESASQTKSLFLAGVSHDLKQPIRAIGLYASFLRRAWQSEHTQATVEGTAAKIEQAVGALNSQISRLLELSRLQSGQLQLNPEWVEVDVLFRDAQALVEAEARTKGIRLHTSHRGQRVFVDRRMLESILANLLTNAVRHTESGTVYLGTRLRNGYPSDQRLCIEVRDSGPGVATERLALLFEAYRSFDDRQGTGNHGLGLAIAKAQATYMGCDIAVSTGPGRGSTFTLCGLRTDAASAAPARATG